MLMTTMLAPGCVGANVERSPRPDARPDARPDTRPETRVSTAPQATSFGAWQSAFRPRARAAGISADVLDRSLRTTAYLPQIIQLDRAQSEFARPIWDYLDGAVSNARIRDGRAALQRHADLLSRIEARYGVAPEIIVAIWGLESGYGANRGSTHTLSALATLAYEGRRAAFFEAQLIAALRIIEGGEVTPDRMIGSWAGAMGHTQFMPESYMAHAVDFTGDGRRNVWSDAPADALASAAAYIAESGWTRGQPWGVEVLLPAGFDKMLSAAPRPVSEWRRLGLTRAAGGTLPDAARARLMFPAGARGPALLAYDNFAALKEYNISDAYVIAVGHLADRLAGAGAFRAGWPRDDRPLSLSERTEVQRRLNALGYDTAGIDGRIGPATMAAVQAFQQSAGLLPDGYVTPEVLERLRRR
ncbi:lytic murein transglycosylase [Roseicitreum antarcticum]|nr:lytic murein transglycosylase [Roseicitreum antarcticum]